VSSNDSHEPVTVTDKRRIDPETGEIRERSATPAPSGPGSAEFAGETPEEAGKAAELLSDLQRVQADFANYRKRALRDQQVSVDRAKASVIAQLLPVLDDLDRARNHGDLESGPLKSVADKLATALEGLGLSGFGDEGDVFDPTLHEAVQHEGEGTHPIVGSVMRRGYKVGDHVVRHALVGVVDTVPDVQETPDNTDVASEQAAESSENDDN
jgi:molecular chaperone GrpE